MLRCSNACGLILVLINPTQTPATRGLLTQLGWSLSTGVYLSILPLRHIISVLEAVLGVNQNFVAVLLISTQSGAGLRRENFGNSASLLAHYPLLQLL